MKPIENINNNSVWKNKSFNNFIFGNKKIIPNTSDDIITKIQSTFKQNTFKENYKNIEEIQNIYEKIQEPLKIKIKKSPIPIPKSIPKSIEKPIPKSITKSIEKPIPKSITKSIEKPTDKIINKSVPTNKTKSINKKIKKLKSKSKVKSINKKMKKLKSKSKIKPKSNKKSNKQSTPTSTNYFNFTDMYNNIAYSCATFIINAIYFLNIYDTHLNKYTTKLNKDRNIIITVLKQTFVGIIFTIPIIIIFTNNLLHIWLRIISTHDPCMLDIITKIPNWKIGMFLQYPIFIVSLFLRILLIYPIYYASPSILSIFIFIMSVLLLFNPINMLYNILGFVSGIGSVIIVVLFLCMITGISDIKNKTKLPVWLNNILTSIFRNNSIGNDNFNNECIPPKNVETKGGDNNTNNTNNTNNNNNNNIINQFDKLIKNININTIVKDFSGLIPSIPTDIDRHMLNLLLPLNFSMKFVFYIISFFLTVSTSVLISPILLISVIFFLFPKISNPFTFLYSYFSEIIFNVSLNENYKNEIKEPNPDDPNTPNTSFLHILKMFLRMNKCNLLVIILLLNVFIFNILKLNEICLKIAFILIFGLFIIVQLYLISKRFYLNFNNPN